MSMEDISCVFQGVAGIGAIYISNLRAAQNINLLNRFGIKAIVTAVRGGIVKHHVSDISDHLYIPADDIQSYDLSKHFQQTYAFIDSARRKTNVLVHCYAGISRSATLVIAYLLRKYNYSLQKVISMVKRRRGIINPNKGFLEQLKKEALRMGISTNQNQKPVEQVLKRNSQSVEKRRAISTSTMKRIINQSRSPQKIGRISFTNKQTQIQQKLQDKAERLKQKQQEPQKGKQIEQIMERSKQVQGINKFEKTTKAESETEVFVQNNILKSINFENNQKHLSSLEIKVNSQLFKSAIYDKEYNNYSHIHYQNNVTKLKQRQELFTSCKHPQLTPGSQKMAKIQKLKMKVLQQKQKKRKGTRRHLSQFHQKVFQKQDQQQKAKTPTVLLSSNELLSLKLCTPHEYSANRNSNGNIGQSGQGYRSSYTSALSNTGRSDNQIIKQKYNRYRNSKGVIQPSLNLNKHSITH